MDEAVSEKKYPIQRLWLFKFGLGLCIVAVLFALYSPDRRHRITEIDPIQVHIIAYLSLIIIPLFLIAMVLYWKNFHYIFGEKFLTVEQGVFGKQQKNLPYGVIQDIFLKQDLFDRIFGLATLVIQDASQGARKKPKLFGLELGLKKRRESDGLTGMGFSKSMIRIPGLKKVDAEALKTILLQKMKENPIDDRQSGL